MTDAEYEALKARALEACQTPMPDGGRADALELVDATLAEARRRMDAAAAWRRREGTR